MNKREGERRRKRNTIRLREVELLKYETSAIYNKSIFVQYRLPLRLNPCD